MNEKDLLEQLKRSADDVTPPESLRPEHIEKMLLKQFHKEQSAHQDEKEPVSSGKPAGTGKNSRRRISIYRLAGLAAAFAVVIAASWQAGRLSASHTGAPLPSSRTASVNSRTEEETENPEILLQEAETQTIRQAQTAQTESQSDTAAQAEMSLAPLVETIDPAGSYEAVYEALYEAFGSNSGTGIALYGARQEIASSDMAAAESSLDTGSSIAEAGQGINASEEASYSTTNTQEANVDEGDLVKTDGTWIYILKANGLVLIVDPDNGSRKPAMSVISQISLEPDHTPQEIYLDGDHLSVITTQYYTEMDTSDENVIASHSGMRTWLYTYDISDRENPVLEGSVSVDGTYSQSRKNGDYMYLFTRYNPTVLDTYGESRIVPATSRGDLEPDQIYLPEYLSYSSYLVAASVNLQDPGEIADQKAVVSVPSTFYVSEESIYIANENWEDSQVRTSLLKLSYRDGSIVGTAAGYVEGYLHDSFSLSEYNGYLRVVTTRYDEDYNESNGLYILDGDLQITGSITDLAPDETIRSARFLGDMGYFVTFRQTDPLFSVDLSDPANPRVLDSLKITGFSTYLHFYSDTLLLGLGYEADEETGVQTGLKLSMFDISDPAHITEVSRLVLDGITWCESLEDYKSILIDPEKNLFGFTCDSRYLVFSYDEEEGFICQFIYDFYQDIISDGQEAAKTPLTGTGTADPDDQADASTPTASMDMMDYLGSETAEDSYTRGLYINDTLYLVRPGRLLAFDMTGGYRQTGELKL